MQPVSAVLFVMDLRRVATFYEQALGMTCMRRDEDHAQFDCEGFSFIVHQIPKAMLRGATSGATERRTQAALRLDFPVPSIEASRRIARALGGDVDASPPPWADANAGLFLGNDPEGNVFLLKQA
ncbi:putative enzyme related to lactoylglutathione lyase [Povalibacter uvarum]|uniref:Putative enzyme related to lactoylglutathione lyase n=1 Tax=Povalibacter uvarum TaxID=732238 RepID=A0A841HMM3_9GAMM|nr:VOC family protein [Povalibacter uvarum]MBB6093205.1 putative enzyme related to lactoylglutathione lyase [Povalibacter uvarum]